MNEKTEYHDKLGPIPAEHFDNDLPFESKGDKALAEHAAELIKAGKAKAAE